MKRWLVILVIVILLPCLGSGIARAQADKSGPMAKLTHGLVNLHDRYSAHVAQRSAAPFRSADPLVSLVADRVVIDAVASGDVDSLKADLLSLGMRNAASFGRVVSGQLPITVLPAAAGLVSLGFAQAAAAITNAGSVTSQGDQAMRSNVARASYGVDGSGVTVGVLSDSFNCFGGAAADITSGDLSPVTVVDEIGSCGVGTDEGRAMLQIVHDVAPGASLAFASAFNGLASFATNIQSLAAAGAKVIVDDVLYLVEPFFQDGIIAQSVNSVVSGGAAYFSAAGNWNRQSYQNAFRAGGFYLQGAIPSAPGAPPFFGGTAHDFDPGGSTDVFQRITLPAGASISMSFQWDSPAFSVSGAPGSPNDLDIYVLNATANQVVAGANTDNFGKDPIEVFSFTNNTGVTADFNIMIVKFAGANPGLIKYVLFTFDGTIQQFATNSGTLFGHANAVGAEAVGAAAYFYTPAFGVSPPILEDYSSSGATPILFDQAGNRLATPELRAKPEIVAPDGVATTVPGFSAFFGTSAAAPHAAGVAALMLQRRTTLKPAGIYASLESTAIDMGVPGFDNDSGFGLIQADAALVTNELFVHQQYVDFLDREPGPGEFTAWLNELDSGLARSSMIEAFMDSGEFHFKGEFIAQVYLGILMRDADYGGFRGWLGLLLAGVSPEQIVQAFLVSDEFQSRFPSNLTNAQFVELMYNNILLRPSDPGGFSGWLQLLNSGQLSRAQVALSFLDSGEFQNLDASQNRVDISLLYFDMLRRDPDTGGFSGWVGVLNAGVPLTSVIDAFLNSMEYKMRIAALVASL